MAYKSYKCISIRALLMMIKTLKLTYEHHTELKHE